MVEVDVFWAYGIGASCATAAGKRLAAAERPFETSYFVKTLLLLSLVWAPTGLLLLLRHPSWETMQAASSFSALPPWLVLGFGITNVTQGILGFWVTTRLLRSGRAYLAHLNWMLGYFGMFFVLLHGWDGLGYDRFLYDRDVFGGAAWAPGAGLQPGAGVGFLGSSVAMTLYLDGVYLLPPLLGLIGAWQREEAREGSAMRWAAMHLGMIFGPALGTAFVAAFAAWGIGRALGAEGSIPLHVASGALGAAIALGGLWVLFYAPGRAGHRALSRLLRLDTGAPRPIAAALAEGSAAG
jgi:hypothetical protein